MGILSFLSSCFVGKSRKIDNSNQTTTSMSIYDIKLKSLDGTSEINMADYKGKYVVIVNTASECGFTPQYEDLQNFYAKYKDKNVVVLGCPCNQFGGQEPGTASEIATFCQKNYGVTFPLTEKIDVKGENQHPLYQWLTQKKNNGVEDFTVKWNFNKFVVNPEGKLVYYFASGVKPNDAEFLKSVNQN
ncbi:MAG: glutathione peroxidase [Bacteroidia bacterium]